MKTGGGREEEGEDRERKRPSDLPGGGFRKQLEKNFRTREPISLASIKASDWLHFAPLNCGCIFIYLFKKLCVFSSPLLNPLN